jgi:lipopolysaccharide export system permease protein
VADGASVTRRAALGGLLDRYVARQFAGAYLVAAVVVVGLFFVVDLATHLDDYLERGGEGTAVARIARYYTLHLPFLYLQVAPFVTLAAGLFSVSRLRRTRESIAALSAGISLQRLLLPVLAAAALLATFQAGLRELATRTFGYERDTLRLLLDGAADEIVLHKVRFKDKSGRMIEVREFLPQGRTGGGEAEPAELRGLDAVRLVDEQWLHYEAREARWDPHAAGGPRWQVVAGFVERLEARGGVREPSERLEDLEFTPDDVWSAWKARENPLDLSFQEARRLAARDPQNVQYRTLQHYLVTFPLANLVLLLVGLPFLLNNERGRGPEGIALGFLLCVFYFGADFVALTLGMQGQISPLLASWLPLLTFGSLGAVLFASMRT